MGNNNFILGLPVETYRDEVLLLIQSENSTVSGLSWQGSESFKLISLPNQDLNTFDLSTSTVIPNFGLLNGNRFAQFKAKLRPLSRPSEDEIGKIVEIKSDLEVKLRKR